MPLPVDVELEEKGVVRRSRDDVNSREGGACADALDDAFHGASACDGKFAVWVDETGHGGGRDHEGQRHGQAEDGALGRDVCDIAHDARTEPDSAVEGSICVASDEVCVGGGVEGPCFGGRAVSGHRLEVLGVDEGFERWFLGGAVWCRLGAFAFYRLGPFLGDGGRVKDALQGFGGKAFFDNRRGMDNRVRLCGVATGVFIYYYAVLSARRVGIEHGRTVGPWETDFLGPLDGLAQSL